MHLRLGADIGGTNSRVGAVTTQGEIVSRAAFETATCVNGEMMADKIASAAREVIAECAEQFGDIQWEGLGMGAPSANYHNGSIEDSPNLRFKGVTPLVAFVKERLGMENVFLTNDANAAALGEHVYGAARGIDDFLMVTLGTGLGGGVYVGGKLVYGYTGFAGELGHITLIPGGRICGYGRQGSFETYCSATGIVRTFFELRGQTGATSSLDALRIDEVTSRAIANAAVGGDALCQQVFEQTGEWLGRGLASIALVTSPQSIFLFGGPVMAGELLLAPTRKAFEAHIISQFARKTNILASALPMGDAAILGAAALLAEAH